MLKSIFTIIITLSFLNLITSQECSIINGNGSFEEEIYIPGFEPSMGITTGQIVNWSASHGTVDYVTPNWSWYGVEGINSNAAHMCYGYREAHDHSEGMFTSAKIYGDDDLLYTLKLDYATVCEAESNGFLNIALNNNLTDEDYNFFQYPTPEVFPEIFADIHAVHRFELLPEANLNNNGFSNYEIDFVPSNDYEQVWFFTEYQHDQEEFVNCGLMIDNVKLTAHTSALIGINVDEVSDLHYLSAKYSKELEVVSHNWTINHKEVSFEEILSYKFDKEMYTICLDIVDARQACGSACIELDLTEIDNGYPTEGCTYFACLDAGGIPNLVSFEYLLGDGQVVLINEKTEGFYFPYCYGSTEFCDGGESKIENFIEDLNIYFNNNRINAEAKMGDEEEVIENFCRSMALTIISSDITPKAFFIDDFSFEEVHITIADFEFNPHICLQGPEETDEKLVFAIVDETTDSQNGIDAASEIFSITPTVFNNNLIIEDKVAEKDILHSEGGIYTTAGELIYSINNYAQGDKISLDGLPTGMYAINLVNKKYQQAGVFFVGNQ